MSFDRCTPESVTGDIVGSLAFRNGGVADDVLAALPEDGIAGFMAKYNQEMGGVVENLPDSLDKAVLQEQQGFFRELASSFVKEKELPDGGKTRVAAVTGLINEAAAPHSLFGWDLIDDLEETLQSLRRQGITEGKEYTDTMKAWFNGVDTTDFSDGQMNVWQQYRENFTKNMYVGQPDSWFLKKIESAKRGAVMFSPRVIAGNYFEAFMKGVPLYGANFFKGFDHLMKERGFNGLFDEIPALRDQGLYGFDFQDGKPMSKAEEIASMLDRPSKNLMYYVGLAEGGTEQAGRKACQRVLFTPSLADIPLIYQKQGTRQVFGLLSYSVGTMQLGVDVIRDVIDNPSAKSYSTAAGLLGMYGTLLGVPAYMAANGEDVESIPIIGPVWKAAADASSISVPTQIGISTEIFNTLIKPLPKVATKLFSGEAEDLDAKDIYGAANAIAFLGTFNNSLVNNLATNATFRRGAKNAIDTVTGEKEAGEAFINTFIPGYID